MPINVGCLSSQINAAFSDPARTDLELTQLAAAVNNISSEDREYSYVDLPPATENRGKMVFLTDTNSYVYSNGSYWSNNFSTTLSFRGLVWTWGCNACGVIGDGTAAVCRSSPVSVTRGFTDWCDISVGGLHMAAIRTDGTMWTWGVGSAGVLGDGTAIARSSPVSVVGGFTDWCQVSAGNQHSLAVRTNGTVWAWGSGYQGKLGDTFTGATNCRSSPVSVVGGFTDWCQVSAGCSHSMGLRTTGSLWTWGNNCWGQLGTGDQASSASPVSVIGGFSDWCQISAGDNHSSAIRTNGTLWAWGEGGNGRLGDGTSARRCSPVSVVGGITDWCKISAGGAHTTAIRTNGSLWTWGLNNCGQLGDASVAYKASPVSVVGGFSDWCGVSAGLCHTLAIRTNGTIWAWGCNAIGQLGNGTKINQSSPVSVVGGFADWSEISAGRGANIALRKFNKGF